MGLRYENDQRPESNSGKQDVTGKDWARPYQLRVNKGAPSMMSKFTSLASAILLATFAVAEQAFDLSKLAEKVRPAVMLVIVDDKSGQTIGTGSGFFISTDGKFVTNHHVIEKGAKITIKSESGAMYTVDGILSDDPSADIAVLQAAAKSVSFLELGSSAKVQVGQHIAVIGSPMGLEGTLSEGIISAKRDLGKRGEWLQMTAGISPGSSGSPVLDDSGKVIGIATLLLRDGQSLNFAVPAERIQMALSALAKTATILPLKSPNEMKSDSDVERLRTMFGSLNASPTQDFNAQAVKLARQIVARYPNDAEAYFMLAQSLALIDFPDEALNACDQSIKLDSDHVPSLILSARLLQDSGKREPGLKRVTHALSINPDDVLAWFTYGELLRLPIPKSDHKEADDKAIDAFKRAIALETKSGNFRYTGFAWSSIARVYADAAEESAKIGWNKYSLSYYERAIEAQKHATEVYEADDASDGKAPAGTLSLTARRWLELMGFYQSALLCADGKEREASIRAEWLRELNRLEKQEPKLSEQFRALQGHGALSDDVETKRTRATRRRILELNREQKRLQEQGLLPPDP